MRHRHRRDSVVSQAGLVVISGMVLLLCLFYTYAGVVWAPYPGMDLESDWVVRSLTPCATNLAWCAANRNALQVGDQLLVIGSLTYEEYWRDRTQIPFGGYQAGDTVPITFRRGSEERTIEWQMLGPTLSKQLRRLLRSVLLFGPFWIAGTLVLLFLRPRDGRWRLLVLFHFVTAVWLAVGVHSHLAVAYASPMQHALAWLLVPVYLHLHLAVPGSLWPRQMRYVLPVLYLGAVGLAGLELGQLLPATAYYIGLLLARLGSMGILILRLWARPAPAAALVIRLMLAGFVLAAGPALVLWGMPTLIHAVLPRGLALGLVMFAFPILPFFYTYGIYKQRLGSLEFRANQVLGLYTFAILYVIVFGLSFAIARPWATSSEVTGMIAFANTLAMITAAPTVRAWVQRGVNRLAYGARHEPDEILRLFIRQIPRVFQQADLVHMLTEEILPSLFVRQSALYFKDETGPHLIYAQGVHLPEGLETEERLCSLLAEAGRYRPPLEEATDDLLFDWVRLVIPLANNEQCVGLWLFGRRDPDDYYTQQDCELLTFLASQVGVLLEKIHLSCIARFTLFAMDRAGDAIMWIDQKGRFRFVNEAACERLGYSPSELLSMSVFEISPRLSKETWPKQWELLKAEGQSILETYHLTKDGRRIPVEVVARNIIVPLLGILRHARKQRKLCARVRSDSGKFLRRVLWGLLSTTTNIG